MALMFEKRKYRLTGTNPRLGSSPASKSSSALTWENVEDALEYGQYQGLGQWRTGGNGTFTWERID